jgi:hypothetical protein
MTFTDPCRFLLYDLKDVPKHDKDAQRQSEDLAVVDS